MITKKPLFYWIFHKYRGLQLFLLLLIIVSLFFKVFPLEMQRKIINVAISLKKLDLLYLYCGLYMGAVLIAGLLKYYINVLQAIIGQKILIHMRRELYTHVLKMPLQFFHRTQTGIIISAMTSELNAIGQFLGGAIAIPIASFLTFVTFLGFMIYLNPILGCLTILIYPFEFIVIPLLQKRYNIQNRKRVRTTRSMANLVNESVSGIHEVQSTSSFQLEQSKLDGFIKKLYKIMRKLFIFKYGIKFSNNFFQSLGPFLLFLLGGYLAINGQFTIGALVAFLSAYEKVYDPWKEIIEYYQMYQDAQVRYRQIMDTFDMPEEMLLDIPQGDKPITLQGKIEARDVGYEINSDVRLLEEVSFDLEAGKHLALIGFSGSGKSTLSNLVGQLLSHTDGTITIDGHDISGLSKLDIARNISTVSQHPFIFTGTVNDNLLYACEALRQAGHDVELPDRNRVLHMVREVGLEADVIRWGFRSILPSEKAKELETKILSMRTIVHETLRSEFEGVVEFYDAEKFLEYSNISQNIIFGEYDTDKDDSDYLIDRQQFQTFLHKQKLWLPLIQLGYDIAETTITLLQDMREDEFFFKGSPMEQDEFDLYEEIIKKVGRTEIEQLRRQEINRLLQLALRYKPGEHKIFTMSDSLRDKIVEARHIYLLEVEHVNIEQCKDGTIQRHILPMNQQEVVANDQQADDSYTPLCTTQYLYNHTLLDNVLFGTVIDRDAIRTQLGDLALKHFSEQGLLDEIVAIGLDFHVGSKGDNLSGGQKQKIAIARALLKQTPLLILDEATASLDNSSQTKIQKYIDNQLRGKATVIAVVHRLDMISGYDHIIVMKAGKIVESGTYDKLLQQKGVLYELVNESGESGEKD
ncbi:MAG: ABC transporter transmembrane domain-containing protein [Desulfocapsaceae bacterium]|nr:ABC transporter transmembrane domain-containing protein [Desulfocapsaceae bacterium]